jgi:hypothetical protein
MNIDTSKEQRTKRYMFKRSLFVLVLVCSLLVRPGTSAPVYVVRGVLPTCDWEGFLLPEAYFTNGTALEKLKVHIKSRINNSEVETPRLYQAYECSNGLVQFFEIFNTEEILRDKLLYSVTSKTPLWMYAAVRRTDAYKTFSCGHLVPDAPPPPQTTRTDRLEENSIPLNNYAYNV